MFKNLTMLTTKQKFVIAPMLAYGWLIARIMPRFSAELQNALFAQASRMVEAHVTTALTQPISSNDVW